MRSANIPLVFVVDDEKPIVDTVCEILADAGLYALGCSYSYDALRCIEELHPSLVILDVQMLGIDGIQIFHQMQEHPEIKHIPVVFFTANSHIVRQRLPDYEQRGARLLPKPFNIAKLLDLVEQSLES